jgi:hypothetical protein
LDGAWIAQSNKAVRSIGLDYDYLTNLAEHARDYMRMPVVFQFLVAKHEDCLAGRWDVKKTVNSSKGDEEWYRANQMILD